MTDMNEVILKADRRGRLRYTAGQKQALVDAYEASGLSGPRFASLHGVNYQTLVSWLKKRRQNEPRHPALTSCRLPLSCDRLKVEDSGRDKMTTTLVINLLIRQLFRRAQDPRLHEGGHHCRSKEKPCFLYLKPM